MEGFIGALLIDDRCQWEMGIVAKITGNGSYDGMASQLTIHEGEAI